MGLVMNRFKCYSACSFLSYFSPMLLVFSQLFSVNIQEAVSKESPFIMSQMTLDHLRQQEPHLFKFWDDLTIEKQAELMAQISRIDLTLLDSQRKLVHAPLTLSASEMNSFDAFDFSGNQEDHLRGEALIKQGRLGCLMLAGGQGTRLKIQGPKGRYPISVIKNKSLFQLAAEKVSAASKQAEYPLRLAIMTSPENDAETQAFFEENDFFGLPSDQIDFFIQDTLPLLDVEGNLFLENPSKIAAGPDGNGHSLLRFVESGIWEKWKEQGIEYVNLILIDNPLAVPFDPELLGFHVRQQAEISLKCTEKYRPDEKVGVLVKFHDHCGVVEYSEISSEEKEARRPDGRLKHCCANLSLFCFSMPFIKRLSEERIRLPLHKAWKTARTINAEGKSELSSEPIAWKYETFIFDWLEQTNKVAALLYPREDCFAPLKNFSGGDSPDTVREALQKKEREILKNLTGLTPPEFLFELAADFYYPTAELREKWQGRLATTAYIDP